MDILIEIFDVKWLGRADHTGDVYGNYAPGKNFDYFSVLNTLSDY